jgi:hypothetical protein
MEKDALKMYLRNNLFIITSVEMLQCAVSDAAACWPDIKLENQVRHIRFDLSPGLSFYNVLSYCSFLHKCGPQLEVVTCGIGYMPRAKLECTINLRHIQLMIGAVGREGVIELIDVVGRWPSLPKLFRHALVGLKADPADGPRWTMEEVLQEMARLRI